jgi:hypothetical protein
MAFCIPVLDACWSRVALVAASVDDEKSDRDCPVAMNQQCYCDDAFGVLGGLGRRMIRLRAGRSAVRAVR